MKVVEMSTPDSDRQHKAGDHILLKDGPFTGMEATVMRIMDSGASLYVVVSEKSMTHYMLVKTADAAKIERSSASPEAS